LIVDFGSIPDFSIADFLIAELLIGDWPNGCWRSGTQPRDRFESEGRLQRAMH